MKSNTHVAVDCWRLPQRLNHTSKASWSVIYIYMFFHKQTAICASPTWLVVAVHGYLLLLAYPSRWTSHAILVHNSQTVLERVTPTIMRFVRDMFRTCGHIVQRRGQCQNGFTMYAVRLRTLVRNMCRNAVAWNLRKALALLPRDLT
jgi:hypothetical protein